METEGMEQYLDTFKYGMPPHGGLGIGLERLTMQPVSYTHLMIVALKKCMADNSDVKLHEDL